MTATVGRATGHTTDAPLTPARTRFSSDRTFTAFPAGDGRPRAGRGGGVPDVEERARLAATFGTALRTARRPTGMSQRTLSDRSGVSASMIGYLEVGGRRPTAAMVRALAVGLSRPTPPLHSRPPAPEELVTRLTGAAAGSLVVDTPGGRRRRERRCRAAGWRYVRLARRWQAAYEAEATRRERALQAAYAVLDDPATLDDPARLRRVAALLDASAGWQGR